MTTLFHPPLHTTSPISIHPPLHPLQKQTPFHPALRTRSPNYRSRSLRQLTSEMVKTVYKSHGKATFSPFTSSHPVNIPRVSIEIFLNLRNRGSCSLSVKFSIPGQNSLVGFHQVFHTCFTQTQCIISIGEQRKMYLCDAHATPKSPVFIKRKATIHFSLLVLV